MTTSADADEISGVRPVWIEGETGAERRFSLRSGSKCWKGRNRGGGGLSKPGQIVSDATCF